MVINLINLFNLFLLYFYNIYKIHCVVTLNAYYNVFISISPKFYISTLYFNPYETGYCILNIFLKNEFNYNYLCINLLKYIKRII